MFKLPSQVTARHPGRSLNLEQPRPQGGAKRGVRPETMGGKQPDASRLPAKGWCFHRGAKVSQHTNTQDKQFAIWTCSTCGNKTALLSDEIPFDSLLEPSQP